MVGAVAGPMAGPAALAGQTTVREEVRVLDTYPFSEPNPIPMLVRDARLYPYHTFDGYAADSEPAEWKVVVLENEYIEVFVLPEVGGKVWGAVVKETGHEFIYRNEVMKFRNIALRGPWTSGGIEFNFGVIGHAPSTATPVDYLTRQNDDGSASVVVGSMDLPSRTHWRVEIRLPADRAYFETRVFWSNPTPLAQPFYNWMTAAAFAQDDLVMSIPGDQYLKHSGEALPWPVDSLGRDLEPYDNNRFEGNKSYHVVGELNDFFGGYYVGDDYGFGHWARHEEMPGQKLWLWALSRQGGIWEDLLTDTDGQYVEFQAGPQMVQYQPADHLNPITKAVFDPMSASRWSETWFPLEGTGGLTDASRDGALHVERGPSTSTVTVTTFAPVRDTLRVWAGQRLVRAEPIALEPLETASLTVNVSADERLRVTATALRLDYDTDPTALDLARPFETEPRAESEIPEADWLAFEGRELLKARRYSDAEGFFGRAVAAEPWHRTARMGLAELAFRAGMHEDAIAHVNRVLSLDAYDAEANLLAGTVYRALERRADAHDAFGWATRATATRAAAYVGLARMQLEARELDEAYRYARLAIDYDRYNVPAWQVLAMVGRAGGDAALVSEAHAALTDLDPFDHFVRAEEFVGVRSMASEARLLEALGGEFPEQTLLEIAIGYAEVGMIDEASALLSVSAEWTDAPVLVAWNAYLSGRPELLDGPLDVAFAAPFRPETLRVLSWATEHSSRWEWSYLLGLDLWAVGRADEAADVLVPLGNEPTHPAFYVARSRLLERLYGHDPLPDHRRAVELGASDRLMHVALAQVLEEAGAWDEALAALGTARSSFPEDFNLALFEARALMGLERAADALAVLADIRVLPSEHARGTRQLYADAHLTVAMDSIEAGRHAAARTHLEAALEWPENLGEGRPYDAEERLQRLLLAVVEETLGAPAAADAQLRAVVASTDAGAADSSLAVLGVIAEHALLRDGRALDPPVRVEATDRTSRLMTRAAGLASTVMWR